LDATGVIGWKLQRQARNDDVAVLMYHRVLPREEVGYAVQPGMFVEPETLDAHLAYLRKHFTVVSISSLTSAESDENGRRGCKPLCVLTFDDGWFDFYKFAYPLLEKHRVPATVFLPTDFIGTDRWFWTDRLGTLLERLIQSSCSSELDLARSDRLVEELLRINGTREARLDRMIALLKQHAPARIESVLAQLSVALGAERAPLGRAFLTWEEVREMFKSGLITFGSHTATHPLLTTVTAVSAHHEMTQSKNALVEQGVVDQGCITFSYPNGSYSPLLSEMAQEVGYRLALITQRGWYRRGTNLHTIQRIAIHQDVSASDAMFGARIANLI
jgi:peptidoglycan/xylan/chitin deacetylase (PgdA/CDA1 family)